MGAMMRLARVVSMVSVQQKRSIDLIKVENEGIKKFNKQIDDITKVRGGLSAAIKAPAIAKNLSAVLKANLGGEATDEIKGRLDQANRFSKQYAASRKEYRRIDRQINSLTSAMASQRGPRLQATLRKIASLQGRQTGVKASARRSKRRMNVALGKGKAAALGPKGGLANIPAKRSLASTKLISTLGVLSKGFAAAGIIVGASVRAIGFWDKALKESTDIIHKYSHFSLGGLQAASMLQIGDIKRNIYASRQLSDSMIKFARASNAMKDSWKDVKVSIDKIILGFAMVGANIAKKAGDAVNPIFRDMQWAFGLMAKMTDRDIDNLFKNANLFEKAFTVPLTKFFAKFARILDIKTPLDQLEEAKKKVERRRALFQAKNPADRAAAMKNLQPDDIDPLEQFLMGLPLPRRPVAPQFQPFPRQIPRPGGIRNPGLPPAGGPNLLPLPPPPRPRRQMGLNAQVRQRQLQMQRQLQQQRQQRKLGPKDMPVRGAAISLMQGPANGGLFTRIEPGRGYNRNTAPITAGLFA